MQNTLHTAVYDLLIVAVPILIHSLLAEQCSPTLLTAMSRQAYLPLDKIGILVYLACSATRY